jgi:hypothetical protein
VADVLASGILGVHLSEPQGFFSTTACGLAVNP